MTCKFVFSATVPVSFIIGLIYFFYQLSCENELKNKITTTITNCWSPFGGGAQLTEIAKLVYELAQFLKTNSSIVNAFGLSGMIITVVFSSIYTVSQIYPEFCR